VNEARAIGKTRISDLQAVLGLSQLSRYKQMLKRRQEIARSYFSKLPDRVLERLRQVEHSSMFFRFPLFFAEGYDRVAPAFWAKGVLVRRGVDALLHSGHGLSDDLFPNATSALNGTVSLPCYPSMSDKDVDRVISSVLSVLNEL
jgi:dTDP-4-amino-4,6-dideoxygalactose transaminase